MTRRNIAAATALVLCSVVLAGCAVTYPSAPAATSDSTYEVVVEPTTAPVSTPAPTGSAPVDPAPIDVAAAIDLYDLPTNIDALRLPVDTPVTVTARGEEIFVDDATVPVQGNGTPTVTITLPRDIPIGEGYAVLTTNSLFLTLTLEAS